MYNLTRYSLNTRSEADEYASQKRAEGCKDVDVKPLYYKGKQVGYSVYWRKES